MSSGSTHSGFSTSRPSIVLGGIAIAVGIAALTGWVTDTLLLTSVLSGRSPMKPITATAMAIAGLSLIALAFPDRRFLRVIARAGGVLVVLVGLATLAEYLTTWDLGIDQLILRVGDGSSAAGRMGANTAICFILAGVSFLSDRRRPGGRLLSEASALAFLVVSGTTLMGYAYRATSLTGLGSYTQMSINAGLSFLALGLGILWLNPIGPAMTIVRRLGPGAVLIRRALPVAVVVMFTAGLLRLWAQDRGWLGTPVGVALMVITAIAVFTITLFWSAEVINREEAARHQSEENLRKVTEDKFNEILEAAPDAMVIVDASGRIDRANRQTESLFGYPRTELIGQPIEVLIPERFRGRHPMNRQKYFGDPGLRPMGAALDLWGRRRDGTEFPVEISLSPLSVDGGTMAMAAIRDVSVRRTAEAKFRDVLEAAPDAMVLVDRRGRIGLVNSQAERLFGYPRKDLLGLPIETLVPERFHGVHPGHRTAYFDDPRPRPMGTGLELLGRRRDGSEFPVEISLSPVETEEGTMVTAAVRDITDRKRLLEEIQKRSEELEVQSKRAQEANRMKSEFLANMSHELRTPLNAIIGFSELMHDGRVGPVSDEHREYLGDILSSSRHLLQLINDILDLAKVESGKMEFRPEAVDLVRLVGEVRDILRTLAAKKRMTVEMDIDERVRRLNTDPAKLKQVLYNYLSNAIKFTPDHGRVVVRARPEGTAEVRLEVEDTGIGIQPHDLERLFVEFQQLDASASKKYQGTGLGLALTRRIAEVGGGRVEVRSTVGQGSTFSVILPVNQAATDKEEA